MPGPGQPQCLPEGQGPLRPIRPVQRRLSVTTLGLTKVDSYSFLLAPKNFQKRLVNAPSKKCWKIEKATAPRNITTIPMNRFDRSPARRLLASSGSRLKTLTKTRAGIRVTAD